MSLVLDSTVTLAWLLDYEGSKAVDEVFARVISARGWVPALWRLEVANRLTMAVRRKRITVEFRDQSLADLALLNIVADEDTERFAWGTTLALADAHRLTAYDAAYLELALRLGLPLATLDADLRKAAASAGVALLGA